jgi:hypothetical protein
MDTKEIIETIDAEIARLERARDLLNGHTAPVKRGRPTGSNATFSAKPPHRKMSPEGRARIAAGKVVVIAIPPVLSVSRGREQYQ